ncbi:formate acetyltransferase [Micractinium conductrix]|uniref:formate C-acetyltransferase n=1 Tax=Micractinium conductrix TaxID=554055 RepID=A0A2P6V8P5_9CHLO|nr:formate acetyltransferase [Micractinium conductrix]|eukprot:PSC70466.1 formate acetyltransferase [Micractinium conductrix]
MHALTLLAPAGGLAAAGGLATAALPAAACCALAVLGSQARPLSSLRPRVAHADPQEAARAPSRPASGIPARTYHTSSAAQELGERGAADRGFASSALPETAPKGKAAPAAKAAGKGAAGVPAPTIDVQKWVRDSITPWDGDTSFLAKPTQRTLELWDQVQAMCSEELRKGIMGVDPTLPSTITAFPPGYINKDKEVIVGMQTDEPLKRAIKPLGGVGVVKSALEAYGFKLDPEVERIYTHVRKTHNQGVFDAYTAEMRTARSNHILTGLPDGYGRGRIIGDYRRVALYGVDGLIASKAQDLQKLLVGTMTEERIRLREEVQEQIRALKELKEMAATYGDDISRPATNAREAVQWLYYAYLGAVKEQDGAAMSLGRVDGFLDAYIEADLQAGKINEEEAQELIDQFVMKLRIVRQLRTPEYDQLFAGDPTWVTAVLGGTDEAGQHLVTKTSYRILNTLYNLGPAPEPNITILWSQRLPDDFKRFCAKVSIDTSSIQYESDDMMHNMFGSDYGIACCVSAMRLGKDMQFFGARANLGKLLLYAMNSGVDEVTAKQVGPKLPPVQLNEDGSLNYDSVMQNYDQALDWLAALYANTMNHYMHDKYDYERLQMALHDTYVRRLMAYGMAGLSVVADSLSAIKHAKVFPVYNDQGIMVDFKHEGEWPTYGNDDDRVDSIARDLVAAFHDKLASQHTYRASVPTLSVLTITSNVVYGKATGNTPDGRKRGEPFAPGANPMHGRDSSSALASLNSVASIPYKEALDGVSNTFTLIPATLGKVPEDRINNLVSILDGYCGKGGHHININVLQKETLMDAMEHPEKYPQLTIRVSGYAVHFHRLTREQQLDVINRTFQSSL